MDPKPSGGTGLQWEGHAHFYVEEKEEGQDRYLVTLWWEMSDGDLMPHWDYEVQLSSETLWHTSPLPQTHCWLYVLTSVFISWCSLPRFYMHPHTFDIELWA
jgi:hypothetical protein